MAAVSFIVFFIVVNRGNTLMKPIILISSLLLLNTLVTETQAATCSASLPLGATQVLDPALTALLQGNTVCVGNASPWQAQEYHQTPSGGTNNLIDFKHGNLSVNDPTAPVGSWAIDSANNTVSYTYHGSSIPYVDTVYKNTDGSYTFCDQSGNTTNASVVLPGQVGC
jgi:hypothetical protein